MEENALNIYTDGSSLQHPRKGGMGILYILVDDLGNEQKIELPVSGYKQASNNQMELNACIIALKNIPIFSDGGKYKRIVIYTDSQYVVKNFSNALFYWPQTKWLKKGGAPVLNAVLWKELHKIVAKSKVRIEIKKVKGHAKDLNNRRVDKLAKESAKNANNKPLTIKKIRHKLSKEKTIVGCVGMDGQRVTIRIIESEYQKIQKIDRCRYEVMSKASRYYKMVDFIYTNELMKPGHTYSVRFNLDNKNPGIVKLFREIENKK